MARTLVQIRKQIQQLEKEADRVKAQEVAGVVQRIQTAIEFYGLTANDLFGGAKRSAAKRGASNVAVPKKVKAKPKKVASVAKYKDKETGKTWTGHGMRPGWFREAIESGAKPEDMAI